MVGWLKACTALNIKYMPKFYKYVEKLKTSEFILQHCKFSIKKPALF